MSLDPLYVLLGKLSVQILCPFFNCVVCLLWVESCEFFIYFGDQTLVHGIICRYIFPYGWFPFHFADVFFSCAEAFHFDEVPFVYSFLYVPCSREHISENIAVWNIWDFPAYRSPLGLLWCHNIYMSFIHFEFIFVYGVTWCLSFIFFCMKLSRCPNTICWRGYFYSILCFCPFVKC